MVGLHDHLGALGLDAVVDTIVTSAEAGAPKPAPAVFELALARLGVDTVIGFTVGQGKIIEDRHHRRPERAQKPPSTTRSDTGCSARLTQKNLLNQ